MLPEGCRHSQNALCFWIKNSFRQNEAAVEMCELLVLIFIFDMTICLTQ